MKLVELLSRIIGAALVIRGMADAIRFVDILNTLLSWDVQQCRTSPGERILAKVLDILTGKSPLYRVQDSLAETDVPLLRGPPRISRMMCWAMLWINSHAPAYARKRLNCARVIGTAPLGRCKGSIVPQKKRRSKANPKRCIHALEFRRRRDSADEQAVATPPRHSKDHRSDLKQILLIVFVKSEGVLRFGSVGCGNTSDKTLNRRMVDDLVAEFSPRELQDLIYVADSSSVTGPNLAALRDAHLRFILRCPSMFAVAQAAKGAALAQDSWTFVGRIAAWRNAGNYGASEQQGVIDGVPDRLVV